MIYHLKDNATLARSGSDLLSERKPLKKDMCKNGGRCVGGDFTFGSRNRGQPLRKAVLSRREGISPVESSTWPTWLLDPSMKVLVTHSCLTLCHPMDCSPPGSSVHGIFQARILEWASISLSRGSSQPRGWTHISCNAANSLPLSHQGSPVAFMKCAPCSRPCSKCFQKIFPKAT